MRPTLRHTIPVAILALVACGEANEGGGAEVTPQRGRTVYQNVCIACHNADPSVDGSLGPAIAGASLELLQAKVLRGEYPPGYTPKRAGSSVMPRFEYVAEALPDLAAYLAETPTGD